jgi:hypothetical protein
MPSAKKYWFPAKRYGWGWGLPSCWQGWVVLCTFVRWLRSAPLCFPPDKQLGYTSLCWHPKHVAHRNMLVEGRATTLALGQG